MCTGSQSWPAHHTPHAKHKNITTECHASPTNQHATLLQTHSTAIRLHAHNETVQASTETRGVHGVSRLRTQCASSTPTPRANAALRLKRETKAQLLYRARCARLQLHAPAAHPSPYCACACVRKGISKAAILSRMRVASTACACAAQQSPHSHLLSQRSVCISARCL